MPGRIGHLLPRRSGLVVLGLTAALLSAAPQAPARADTPIPDDPSVSTPEAAVVADVDPGEAVQVATMAVDDGHLVVDTTPAIGPRQAAAAVPRRAGRPGHHRGRGGHLGSGAGHPGSGAGHPRP